MKRAARPLSLHENFYLRCALTCIGGIQTSKVGLLAYIYF